MTRRKILCISLSVLSLIVTISVGYKLYSNSEMVEKSILGKVNDYLASYPQLAEPYCHSELYVTGNTCEYLVLQLEGKQLVGQKGISGDIVYWMEGKKWELQEDTFVCEEISSDDTALEDVVTILEQFICDSSLSVSCKTAKGPSLPLWIASGEQYLECGRQNYSGYHEIMAIHEENPTCLRWYMLYPDGDVKVFVHACSSPVHNEWYEAIWGELPEAVYIQLFEN